MIINKMLVYNAVICNKLPVDFFKDVECDFSTVDGNRKIFYVKRALGEILKIDVTDYSVSIYYSKVLERNGNSSIAKTIEESFTYGSKNTNEHFDVWCNRIINSVSIIQEKMFV